MKNKSMFLLIIVLSLMFSGVHVLQAESTPAKGDPFPEITLPVPANPSEREYLGVLCCDSVIEILFYCFC